MTLSHLESVNCPHCGAPSELEVYETINVTEDPALKAALLKGELWTHVCSSCGRGAGVEAPLLYHDMAPPGASPGETWMFQLTFDPAFDARELDAGMDLVPFFSKLCEQQTTRVVRSHRALVEKITVFEAGLDDRCIEVAKGMARRQTPALRESELVCCGRTDDGTVGFLVLSETGRRTIEIPCADYDRIRAALVEAGIIEALAKVRWSHIDSDFGDAVVARLGGGGAP